MIKKIKLNKTKIFFFIFIIGIIYFLSGPSTNTPHNYFVRQAASFLKGKICLDYYLPWLNELVPVDGKYCVVYPPMPAIMLTLFVFLFGENFSQTLFSVLIGLANIFLFYVLLKKLKVEEKIIGWTILLFSLGTNHWFLSSVGSAWYLAHIVAVFFLFLAIIESFSKKRAFLIGLFLGGAFLSRLPTILCLPFFIYLICQKKTEIFKNLFFLFLGLAPSFFFVFLYNFLRFNNFLEFGYKLIPNVLTEPWYQKGIFSLSYIPKNLKLLFWTFPIFIKKPPFILPSIFGMALWITTPAFLIIPRAFFIKEKIIFLSFLTILFLAAPSLLHGEVGGFQFGYRYAMDYMPFLLILTAKSFEKLPKWLVVPIVFLSILVNLWGVLLINKFGWRG